MRDTLANNSGMWVLKSKFFLYRIVSYFFFLLFPIWVQKSLDLPPGLQLLTMILYILFMVSQWFLLGKEIDHRLKIYFRVNSSMDRVVYRLFLGMIFMILYFNLLSFLDSKWIYNCFWATWVVLGLFYSWPTRGKIIQESVSSNFTEFRYLDSFEKTVVGMIIGLFLLSIPELPSLSSIEGLKLYFDPQENFSLQIWNFLTVNYYPFKKYPELFRLAWSMHFYVIGLGFFLVTFYALLRFFISRRLSLLGVFALISTWSYPKLLASGFGDSLSTTYSLIWIWSTLWVTKSATYRSGLFLGLINYYGIIMNQSLVFLSFIQFLGLYFYFLPEQTSWYKRQMLRYALFGTFLCLGVTLANLEKFETLTPLTWDYFGHFSLLWGRKAAFSLSFFGLIIMLGVLLIPHRKPFKGFQISRERSLELVAAIACIALYAVVFEKNLLRSFSTLWIIAFFSILPLEVIFQSLSRLRSKRNMIYLVYILICLLDSHVEGRVKILLRFFDI